MANKLVKYGWKKESYLNMEALISDVGAGWSKIVEDLVYDLLELGWNGEVVQIKEKFGGLRFYVNEASDAVHERIYEAEKVSYATCEDCGNPGALRSGGWLRTLCATHANGRLTWEDEFKEDPNKQTIYRTIDSSKK